MAEQEPGPDARSTEAFGGMLGLLGARVRGLRRERRLTIAELAATTGLSVSMISTVERGNAAPSLATLHLLAEGLEVPVFSFFRYSDEAHQPVVRKAAQQESVTPGGAQRRLALDDPDLSVEVYVDHYEPGTKHNRQPSQHRGYEFGVVLSGSLLVDLDGDTFDVAPGDAIQFLAKRNHLIRNEGDEPAEAVWFNLRRRA